MKRASFALASTLPAAVLGVLAACGSFSGDGAVGPVDASTETAASNDGPAPEAALDATKGDAGGLSCATRTDDPLMCADFDDVPTPRVYSEGTPSDVQQLPNRQVTGPGVSAPNAMWSDARTVAGENLTVSGNTITTFVHVGLDVFVEPYGNEKVDGAFVRVGIQPSQCYVDVRVLPGNVILQTHCVYTDDAADYYRSQEILPNPIVTGQWVHLDLVVDYVAATATASLDGKAKPSLGLNPSAKLGGKPYVDVGIGLDKVRVGFDNVLATTSK